MLLYLITILCNTYVSIDKFFYSIDIKLLCWFFLIVTSIYLCYSPFSDEFQLTQVCHFLNFASRGSFKLEDSRVLSWCITMCTWRGIYFSCVTFYFLAYKWQKNLFAWLFLWFLWNLQSSVRNACCLPLCCLLWEIRKLNIFFIFFWFIADLDSLFLFVSIKLILVAFFSINCGVI